MILWSMTCKHEINIALMVVHGIYFLQHIYSLIYCNWPLAPVPNHNNLLLRSFGVHILEPFLLLRCFIVMQWFKSLYFAARNGDQGPPSPVIRGGDKFQHWYFEHSGVTQLEYLSLQMSARSESVKWSVTFVCYQKLIMLFVFYLL